jgi:uncharacterized protein (TIGR03067 family)
MIKIIFFVCAILLAAPSRGEQTEPGQKTDQDRIQGEWSTSSVEQNGLLTSADELNANALKMIFKGQTLIMREKNKAGEETPFVLDETKKPRTIDITVLPGDEKLIMQGIYEIQGNQLKLCLSKGGVARPREFKTTVGSGLTLFVLKREQSKQKKTEKR